MIRIVKGRRTTDGIRCVFFLSFPVIQFCCCRIQTYAGIAFFCDARDWRVSMN